MFVVFILLLSKYAVERESVWGWGLLLYTVNIERVCGCYFHSTQETQRECVVVTFIVHRKQRERVCGCYFHSTQET